MRKIATIAAGTALAAGVVLVPAAGIAGAATTRSAATANSSVTRVHPRVSEWACEYLGGMVVPGPSITGYVCVGGWFDGELVW